MVRTLNRHSVTALVAAIVFMLAWFALTMHANAGCRQFVRQYHHVQQVVAVHHAQPLVLYKAGADLEAEALADKVARLVTQKLSAKQTQSQTAPTSTVLTQRCASCHNGTKAFSFAGGLSDNQKVRWMEMLAFDKDVPEGMAPVLAKIKADNAGADVTDAVMLAPRLPDGVLQ
jgi:hypothetical protein